MSQNIETNFQQVKQRIEEASAKFNRKNQVQLLAVSKTHPIEAINQIAALGQTAFGESYLQEALPKITARPDLDWHFIGPIQSNKTKQIAENFNWVHSVDRLKIAERLSNQRPKNLPKLNVLLQINISNEPSKSGFAIDEIEAAALQIAAQPGLVVRGLMCIPEASTSFEQQQIPFQQTFAIFQKLQQQIPTMDQLSMGMSGDLEAAIAENSTMVRIGTDIFGKRDAN